MAILIRPRRVKNRREVIGNELLPWNNLDNYNRDVYFFVSLFCTPSSLSMLYSAYGRRECGFATQMRQRILNWQISAWGKKKMGPQSFFEGILLSTGCHSVDLAPTL